MAAAKSDKINRYGWPRLMRLATAAAYLDMTPTCFVVEVANGLLPGSCSIGGDERWDRHAIDEALDGKRVATDWRSDQPGLNAAQAVPPAASD